MNIVIKTQFLGTLFVAGAFWFGVSCICLWDLVKNPIPHLVSAVITSIAVGYLFRRMISKTKGWRFYILLPLLSLFAALTIYGVLVPASWLLFGRHGGYSVYAKDFIDTPVLFLSSGLTLFLPLLLPLAIGTNVVLRNVLLAKPKGS